MTEIDFPVVAATPRDVARRLGHELTLLGTLATTLQGRLAAPCLPDEAPDGARDEAVEAMQVIDLITQSLFVLADFLAEWAVVLDGTATANIRAAVARISLAEIAHRLAATGQLTGGGAGLVEMFDDKI